MKRLFWCTATMLISVGAVEFMASATEDQKQPLEQAPRIVAAGTAVWKLGRAQDNATGVRVQLKDDIAKRLGADYVVLLTPRFAGFPYYVPYWKTAKDGFDITLVDTALASGGTVTYIIPVNREFLVDWVVVKK